MKKIGKCHLLILIILQLFCSTINFAQEATQEKASKVNKKTSYKKLIIPAALMATGLFIHETNGSFSKYKIQDNIQDRFAINSTADDYIQYYPFIAFAILKGLKKEGVNSGKNQLFLLAKSQLLMGGLVYALKVKSKTLRPTGAAGNRSFPSGHTSMSFAAASFLFNEYREKHKIVAWSGYALATTTSMMRVMNDEHWMSDVIFGAGLGILCNELVYMRHNRTRKNKNNSSFLMVIPQVSTARFGLSLDYKF